MPHEMIEDEKYRKNGLYGLILVFRGKDAVGGCAHRNNMCFSQEQLHAMRIKKVARIWQVSKLVICKKRMLTKHSVIKI